MQPPTYASLAAAGPWRALRGCPGRRVWQGSSDLTPADLAGADVPVQIFRVVGAPDPVHVVALADGGLICYARADGRFVHTLNTPEGFARKLDDLGIRLGQSG